MRPVDLHVAGRAIAVASAPQVMECRRHTTEGHARLRADIRVAFQAQLSYFRALEHSWIGGPVAFMAT